MKGNILIATKNIGEELGERVAQKGGQRFVLP